MVLNYCGRPTGSQQQLLELARKQYGGGTISQRLEEAGHATVAHVDERRWLQEAVAA